MSISTSFYGLQARDIHGKTITMETYRGKILLLVNTASKCGFTPQLEGLEALYRKYRDQDFVVLGFPCNQFARQEPGSEQEIENFCQFNYGVSFPMFAKIEVNGAKTHPVFAFLKSALPNFLGGRILWNFTKFVIDPNGKPLKRFAPWTKPDRIEKYLIKQGLLKG